MDEGGYRSSARSGVHDDGCAEDMVVDLVVDVGRWASGVVVMSTGLGSSESSHGLESESFMAPHSMQSHADRDLGYGKKVASLEDLFNVMIWNEN